MFIFSSDTWLKLIIIPIVTATVAGIMVEIIKPGLIRQTVEDIVVDNKPGTLKLFTYQYANMKVVIDGSEYHIAGPNYDNPTPIILSCGNHNIKAIIGTDSSEYTVLVPSGKTIITEIKVAITPPPKLGKLKLCADRQFEIQIEIDDSVLGSILTFVNLDSTIYANDLHARDIFLKEGAHRVHITANNQTIDTNVVVTEADFCLLYLHQADFEPGNAAAGAPATDNIIPNQLPVAETPVVMLSPCEANRTGSFAVSNNTGMPLKLNAISPNGYKDERYLPNGATTNFPNYPVGKYQLSAFYTQRKKEQRLWDDVIDLTQCDQMPPIAIVITGENPLEAEERDRSEKRARNAEAFQEAKPYISTGVSEILKRLPWK